MEQQPPSRQESSDSDSERAERDAAATKALWHSLEGFSHKKSDISLPLNSEPDTEFLRPETITPLTSLLKRQRSEDPLSPGDNTEDYYEQYFSGSPRIARSNTPEIVRSSVEGRSTGGTFKEARQGIYVTNTISDDRSAASNIDRTILVAVQGSNSIQAPPHDQQSEGKRELLERIKMDSLTDRIFSEKITIDTRTPFDDLAEDAFNSGASMSAEGSPVDEPQKGSQKAPVARPTTMTGDEIDSRQQKRRRQEQYLSSGPAFGNNAVIQNPVEADSISAFKSSLVEDRAFRETKINVPTDVSHTLQAILSGRSSIPGDIQHLKSYIQQLQAKAQQLETIQKREEPSGYQILYRIWQNDGSTGSKRKSKMKKGGRSLSGPFLDHPEWVPGGAGRRIRCQDAITNLELFLERNKHLSFVVFKDFDIDINGNVEKENGETQDQEWSLKPPQHTGESVFPISDHLSAAIGSLLNAREEFRAQHEQFADTFEVDYPYLFIYHSRTTLTHWLSELSPAIRQQFSQLYQYVVQVHGDEYARVDSLLGENKISSTYVQYLIKPGDTLVSNEEKGYRGYVAESWPKFEKLKEMPRSTTSGFTNYGASEATVFRNASDAPSRDKTWTSTWSFKVWYWDFDGNFQKKSQILHLEFPLDDHLQNDLQAKEAAHTRSALDIRKPRSGLRRVADLNVYPLEYASPELADMLRRRGKMFWSCRNRRLVSYYENEVDFASNITTERYMVDMRTYRKLHPGGNLKTNADELGTDLLAQENPPNEQFEYLLPLKISGYNLRRKQWLDLVVDRIADVQWNKASFQSLVIERKARDLIRALVSNQLEAEKATDLISGKGNGLILLLHGGPGTGKTLTAESVAEIAEKPLYRVTCGDVGTKAEDVEKYLESVLHLGKIWDCVVLLDEADVFLEQRSLVDLQRNALVSVFLRVLEYYEGILILTSNRVGTFDEAFRSRIQLALHYPNLKAFQRYRIWENFIRRLEAFNDGEVDTNDLREHLDELKDEKLNGREIRNAITTARQYAKWKHVTMTYEHLKDVIDISTRFDKYLHRLNRNSSEQQAEDEGLRLADLDEDAK